MLQQQHEALVNLDEQVMRRLHEHKKKHGGGALAEGSRESRKRSWALTKAQETQSSGEGHRGYQARWSSLGGSIQTLPGVSGTEQTRDLLRCHW